LCVYIDILQYFCYAGVKENHKLLRAAGLIDCERRGLWAYYFVCREHLAALHGRVLAQSDALR
jgi:ArsR family transcriptional regulator